MSVYVAQVFRPDKMEMGNGKWEMGKRKMRNYLPSPRLSFPASHFQLEIQYIVKPEGLSYRTGTF